MSFLSERVKSIKPSVTLAITAKAKTMKADGIDIIGFGAGEPDFNTPDNINKVAIEAINEGFTKYTAEGGTEELKKAVIHRIKEDCDLEYKPENILISCGGKHSIYNLFQAVINSGDEVIIPAPYWVSYPDMVILADGSPVMVDCPESQGFKMTPGQLESAITEKTKIVIINSPSNPTGAAYSEEELRAIAEVALRHKILILSDEIYNRITYDGFKATSIASLGEEVKAMTMITNGVSKTYSMTGWRIGYMAGNAEIIKAMGKIQGQSTSNPTSISQAASVEALEGDQSAVDEMAAEFEKRKEYIVERLNNIDGVRCLNPYGAFYVFPNMSAYFGKSYKGGKIEGSADLTTYLLEKAKVAVVPGGAFGADEHIRLSYATSMDSIKKGLDRIEEALKTL